jgi:hypothetical protein
MSNKYRKSAGSHRYTPEQVRWLRATAAAAAELAANFNSIDSELGPDNERWKIPKNVKSLAGEPINTLMYAAADIAGLLDLTDDEVWALFRNSLPDEMLSLYREKFGKEEDA